MRDGDRFRLRRFTGDGLRPDDGRSLLQPIDARELGLVCCLPALDRKALQLNPSPLDEDGVRRQVKQEVSLRATGHFDFFLQDAIRFPERGRGR